MNNENKIYNQVIGFDPIKCECKTITMCNLQSGGKTIFQLQRLMNNVSFDLINFKLSQLESIGLIYKRVTYAYPAETRYFLTSKGWNCVKSLRNYVDVDSIAV